MSTPKTKLFVLYAPTTKTKTNKFDTVPNGIGLGVGLCLC